VRVFGESWLGASTPLAAMGVAFIAMAIPTGPLTAFRAHNQLNVNLVAQGLIAATVIGCTAALGLSTSDGMLRGFATGHVLSAAIAWVLLVRVVGRLGNSSGPREGGPIRRTT
jgi:hypothetical protein